MKKQIMEYKKIEGKTVLHIAQGFNQSCPIIISFTDDTFLAITIQNDYDNFPEMVMDSRLNVIRDLEGQIILEAELCTREEYRNAIQQREEYEKQREEKKEKDMLKELIKKYGVPEEVK